MWQFYDKDEYPDDPKEIFKVVGLCLLGWVAVFALLYLFLVLYDLFR